MKKRVMLILSCLFVCMGLIVAQTTRTTGTVLDSNGEPVISASVVVKGTTIGTVTDLDGKFSIGVPEGNNTLVFTLVGMETLEERASQGMHVVMEYDSKLLSEVEITVAYGTAKKSSFTGAAGVVSSKELGKLQVSNLSKALEGVVPGLQIAASGGQPGSSATMRVRGYGSLAAGNNPLVVVDGTVFDGSLNSINNQDVESITVLKDAASTALYGSRAANGVIIITTKKGQVGKPKIELNIRQGINVRGSSLYETISDTGEYLTTYWQGLYNDAVRAGTIDPGQYASDQLFIRLSGYNPYLGVANDAVVDTNGVLASGLIKRYTDNWKDELFRTGYRQEYNVSVSSGTDKSTTYLSLGYLGDEGIVEGTGFDRFSARLNSTYDISTNIKVGGNLSYSRTEQDLIKSSTNSGATSNAFYFINNIAPIYPVYLYDLEGNKMTSSIGKALYDYGNGEMPGTTGRQFASMQNPLAAGKDDKNKYLDDNISGRGTLDYSFLDGFKFSTNLGYDVINRNRDVFYNPLYGDSKGTGRVQKYAQRYETITSNQLLNYNKVFNNVHSLSVLAGHESYSYKMRYLYAEKQGTYLDDVYELNNATLMSDMSSYSVKKSLESYLSQVLYDYKSKYYFSASLRRDGSSMFHRDNRWGSFWSVGGSWRISEEDFMESATSIDNLRLRASYGTTGNDAILTNTGYNNYKPYDDQYTLDSSGGLTMSYKGNKDLKWEKNGSFNIGMDLGLFSNRLRLDFDYYIRKSSDLLYNRPYAPSSGISYIPENIGDMKNTGIEFTVSGDIIRTQDFDWTATITGSHNKNKVTSLPKDEIVSGARILRVGGTTYDYYLMEYAGVDASNGDALWYYIDQATGDKLTTNNPTEAASSRIVAGSALPDFTGGLNMSFRYKQLDFSVMTNFQIGGKVLDANYQALMHAGNTYTNWHVDIRNAWTETNTDTNVPRLGTTYQNANSLRSTRFLIGADFFNIRSLTLGYTLPPNLLKDLKLSNLRVYLSGDNVALFSKRKGLDPRQALSSGVAGLSNVSGSSDYGYTPISTYSIGINLSF